MTAPSAQTASPPHTSVSIIAVLARTKLSFSTRCMRCAMASALTEPRLRQLTPDLRICQPQRGNAALHTAPVSRAWLCGRYAALSPGDSAFCRLLGTVVSQNGENHAEKAELSGHRHRGTLLG